jgi:hypothetical protein
MASRLRLDPEGVGMPDASEILAGLAEIANRAIVVAVVWHVLIAGAAVALGRGWRPQADVAATLLASLPASVAMLAIAQENWFTGVAFSAIAIALLFLSTQLGWAPVRAGAPLNKRIGIALVVFGYLYPHFLESVSPLVYLVAAPVGVVPCPTLAVVIGFTLLEAQRFTRSWVLVVSAAGLFYGAVGVLRLGVWLDVPLVLGALVLLTTLVPVPRSKTTMTAASRA